MKTVKLLLIILLMSFVFFENNAKAQSTVVDIIVNSPDHTILETAVIAAGLADDLSGTGPFTVFAPTDAAFNALPAGTLEALLQDPTGALAQILLYHVASGKVMSTDLSDGQMITTLQGKTVKVSITAEGVFINNAKVTVADLQADNGVVHVIDAVLLPPAPTTVVDIIVNSPDHTILETAVIAAELDDDLSGTGPFTVFAPTDAAFNALPAGTLDALLLNPTGALAQILLYHVASGKVMSTDLSDGQMVTTLQGKTVKVSITAEGVFINNAKVTVADLVADNGVVHVIDAVLLPPAPTTVVDIIVNSPDHTILETAVIAAELDDDLSGPGPFTVFAPTDAAFNALPAGTLDALLLDPTGALAQILLYHVASGKVMSTDLSDGQMITTLQGKTVMVSITAEGVFINNAKVTVADLVADNGVVHVIDAVLLPPAPTTVVDIIVNSPDHTILETAVIAAELDDDLSGPGPFTVFAPTDAAFNALPAGTLDALLLDPTGALAQILLYHVASGKVMSTDLSDGQMITTLQGKTVKVSITAEGVFINNAKVTVADLVADNGVVHVIDAVLLPPAPTTVVDIIVNSPDHTILETAVIAAELDDDLSGTGPFTVFAPTDAAFNALPAGTLDALLLDPTGALAQILLYHVASGKVMSADLSDGQMVTTLQGKTVKVSITAEGVFINNAKVTVADLVADNGVVHVIDAVLLPPAPTTVVDIIVNSPDHTILETAVIAAGLADDLSGPGPFTVFAPTDAAFNALPAGLLDAMLQDPTGSLAQILLYHVASGKVMSTDLSDGQMITTLEGRTVKVSITAEGVFINNAKVTIADLVADNGVVHVIDATLLMEAAFPIDFEAPDESLWTIFANGTGAPDDVIVIPNPDKTGINTSGYVGKFKVNDDADPWAGIFSDSYAPVEFTQNSHMITMMVWKSVISPVGFKVEGSTNGGPVTEVKVSNTLTNQWEKLTFDFSALIGYSYNRIVNFPDFPDTRTSGTTVYVDNFEKTDFTALPGVNLKSHIKVYPNPVVDVLNITFSKAIAKAEVSVYNSLGLLVESAIFTGKEARLDVSKYAPGLYFLKVNDGSVVKFIK